jgi:UDP-glucuronate decarboxylase
MKILVTGGAGFIGSHLCEELLVRGHEVICLDNFYTGAKANIKELLTKPNFRFIEHDVTNPLEIKVDGIFNLACPASPVQYQKNPVETLKTSVLGALNMLNLARQNDARILQASTSEVYGDPDISPQPEEYWGNVNPIGVRSCYDEGKRAAETLFMDFHRLHGTDIRIARIFNTFGPNMAVNDGRVVSNFINNVINNVPINLYGDGSQTRTFCYVSDLVSGLIALFFAEKIFEPINLGGTEEISMIELANQVMKLVGRDVQLLQTELPQDDPKKRKPDISKARELLDWEPTTLRKNGLEHTIRYFVKVKEALDA